MTFRRIILALVGTFADRAIRMFWKEKTLFGAAMQFQKGREKFEGLIAAAGIPSEP